MEDSQEKDTFPNLNDALVYERKFKSEYLERQIYERLLKSETSIVKLIENKSKPSIVKFIEKANTCQHLKKRARRAREPSRIPLLFLRGLNKKNSLLK